MTPFLQSIAHTYLQHESDTLLDTCFVFPNRRSTVYFTDYMREEARKAGRKIILPETTTIVDFTESFSGRSIPADRMEMVFILFGVYRDVVGAANGAERAASIDFNSFVQWADVLLNDFDDVDHALADPEMIFANVENLKELSANYLTPEQIEVLGHYYDTTGLRADMEHFWKHIDYPGNDDTHKASHEFLRIWQALNEVYRNFQKRLEQKGLHSPGMSVRRAAAAVKAMGAGDFRWKRYVFVGFDTITNAQLAIMKRMQTLRHPDGTPLADFYWDLASPAFSGARQSDGARTVARYAQMLPPLYPCISPVGTFPPISVVGVPSRVGQAKAVGEILDKIRKERMHAAVDNTDGEAGEGDNLMRDIAVVLPEENLLTPLLSSLPDGIGKLNITMGYKLRNTAVAGLLRDIALMQRRTSTCNGEKTFFWEDVVRVLSNPIMQERSFEACVHALFEIQTRHLMSIPRSFFEAKDERRDMLAVFNPLPDRLAVNEAFDYQRDVVEWLETALTARPQPDNPTETAEEPDGKAEEEPDDSTGRETITVGNGANDVNAVQRAFLQAYAEAIDRLREFCTVYLPADAPIEKATAFTLADRMVQGEMISFDGLPLIGLQIMGVLEARSLDFSTLIIPSMNERVFPRVRFTASFIPPILRRAYGLTTPDQQEAAIAYRFYRMISRAGKVYLLYDARATGRRTQPSRFIHQLEYIYRPANFRRLTFDYRMHNPGETAFTVAKSESIKKKLERYRTQGPDALNLSASSIELYMNCPMAFYLQYIAGYAREDQHTEWIDESTYGTIVHEVLENIYAPMVENAPGGALVEKATLDNLLEKGNRTVDVLTTRAINRNFLHLPDDQLEFSLTGQNNLIGQIVAQYVKKTIERDRDLTPFVYLHGEWGKDNVGPLTLTDDQGKSMTINFTCRIDRVDKIYDPDGTPRLRIVDYKTGGDAVSAKSLEDPFTDHKTKGLLQLMLYAQAYAADKGLDEPIALSIYSLRKLMQNPVGPYEINIAPFRPQTEKDIAMKFARKYNDITKWRILDYRDYAPQFNARLIQLLEELFSDEPFRCTDNEKNCGLCRFSSICHTDSEND